MSNGRLSNLMIIAVEKENSEVDFNEAVNVYAEMKVSIHKKGNT